MGMSKSPVRNSAMSTYREALRRIADDHPLTVRKLAQVANLLRQGTTDRALPGSVRDNLNNAALLVSRAAQIAGVAASQMGGTIGPAVTAQILRYIGRAAVEIGAPPPGFIAVHSRRRKAIPSGGLRKRTRR